MFRSLVLFLVFFGAVAILARAAPPAGREGKLPEISVDGEYTVQDFKFASPRLKQAAVAMDSQLRRWLDSDRTRTELGQYKKTSGQRFSDGKQIFFTVGCQRDDEATKRRICEANIHFVYSVEKKHVILANLYAYRLHENRWGASISLTWSEGNTFLPPASYSLGVTLQHPELTKFPRKEFVLTQLNVNPSNTWQETDQLGDRKYHFQLKPEPTYTPAECYVLLLANAEKMKTTSKKDFGRLKNLALQRFADGSAVDEVEVRLVDKFGRPEWIRLPNPGPVPPSILEKNLKIAIAEFDQKIEIFDRHSEAMHKAISATVPFLRELIEACPSH